MLEITIESYAKNLFYKSQNVEYSDLFGLTFNILDAIPYGVNYEVSIIDEYGNYDTKILGGHEIAFIDFQMETVE